MTKKTTTLRLSQETERQIKELYKFGGLSNVVAIAVDRLYCQEVINKSKKTMREHNG